MRQSARHGRTMRLDRRGNGQSGRVADWVFSIVDRMGSLGVGLLILLENLVPPIPSEVVLPLAGFRSSTGDLDVFAVWCAATLGAVVGALVLYGLGAGLGYDRLYRLAGHRWFVLASQSDIDRGHALFERHGGKVVLLARCVPFLRSVVSIPAGVLGMPLPRFVTLTAIGSGVWNVLFIGGGYLLGSRWQQVEQYSHWFDWAVAAFFVIAIAVWVTKKLRTRTRT